MKQLSSRDNPWIVMGERAPFVKEAERAVKRIASSELNAFGTAPTNNSLQPSR